MGLLSRLFRSHSTEQDATPPPPTASEPEPCLLPGSVNLEVVGESRYQDALWKYAGTVVDGRVRQSVRATLIPEPQNMYDPNAIAVQIDGQTVGYLPAALASDYLPGLRALMVECKGSVALEGVVVGREQGYLGVWLKHDPAKFRANYEATSETGASDGYFEWSWRENLPEDDLDAIAHLRLAIASSNVDRPIDRHFQYAELEQRLYRRREVEPSALTEFDDVCRRHDAEMPTIRTAFIGEWGKVPRLNLYRQMVIRQQKRQDWAAGLWWAERGIQIYGDDAGRRDSVDDLVKRRDRCRAKLNEQSSVTGTPAAHAKASVPVQTPAGQAEKRTGIVQVGVAASDAARTPVSEILTCSACGGSFERVRTRGRKPKLCPDCREQ